jgi:hypothetical protein
MVHCPLSRLNKNVMKFWFPVVHADLACGAYRVRAEIAVSSCWGLHNGMYL